MPKNLRERKAKKKTGVPVRERPFFAFFSSKNLSG